MNFTEEELEQAYIEILEELGWKYIDGRQMERDDYHEVILEERLREAVYSLNKNMPTSAKEEAIRKVMNLSSPILIKANEEFHKMLTDGVDIGEYVADDKTIRSGGKIYLVDFQNINRNEFLAINQFTIIGNSQRRPDIILYINGLPLVVIELKSLSNDSVGIKEAYTQLERYKLEITDLFKYNAFMVISDGVNAKAGTISSNEERFMSFRTIDGINIVPTNSLMMEVLSKGMLSKERILEIIKDYILFLQGKNEKIKILAQYHQFFAVRKALEKTKEAQENDGKIGVVWHTQGSGKSLTMVFYTGQLMKKFNNPTVIVLTDRNDLDNQLFGTFSKAQSYLVDMPKQAESKEELKELLNVSSGGIIFTTIQKFSPKDGEVVTSISDRKDIYIIADEAHRSQYGLDAKMDLEGNSKYGYAKYVRDALPNANYIGFTGTPIDFEDRST
ncbi:HsdR family type I site-specific deoxyribonuclease, partial [Fusobacterium mortiferum]|nr:type I restriction endonuclease subunit R [Fusobacterium mortiferum]